VIFYVPYYFRVYTHTLWLSGLFPHIILFYSFMPCYSMVQLYGFVCHTHKALHLVIFWCTHTLLPCYSLLQAHLITMLFFGLDMPCDSFDLGLPSNKSLILFGSNHAYLLMLLFGLGSHCYSLEGFWVLWAHTPRFALLPLYYFSMVLWLGLHTHKFALFHCYLGFCWLTHTHKFSLWCYICWFFIITRTFLGF
jgi:hypothetical protein